jgi:hypothetical protein
MTPCERVRYYRSCLKALGLKRSEVQDSMAEVYEHLIAQNLPKCRAEEDGQREADRTA